MVDINLSLLLQSVLHLLYTLGTFLKKSFALRDVKINEEDLLEAEENKLLALGG